MYEMLEEVDVRLNDALNWLEDLRMMVPEHLEDRVMMIYDTVYKARNLAEEIPYD